MRQSGLKLTLAIGTALLVGGCASSNTVSVNSVEPVYKIKNDRVMVDFKSTKTTGSISVEDWTRVENLLNITGNEDKAILVSKPASSPTQDAIVFFEQKGEVSAIYRQSMSSRAKTSVATERGLNLTPTFTPDGRFLVFSSDRSGEGQNLWRKRSDGAGGITQITTSSSFDIEPSVSSDGETIIFQSHRLNNLSPSIWSVNMNGGLLTQLSDGRSPRVSPDGRRIVYVKPDPRTGQNKIWLMQIDGSGQTQLSSGDAEDRDPSWHPNGRFIVFSSNAARDEKGRQNFDLWLMRADGTERTQLTNNISHDDAPVFDNSGRAIVFRSNRGGLWNLYSFSPRLGG